MNSLLNGQEILSSLLAPIGLASWIPILGPLLPHLPLDIYTFITPYLIVFVLWLTVKAIKSGMQLKAKYWTSTIEVLNPEHYAAIELVLRTTTWKAKDPVSQFQLVSEEEAKPADGPSKSNNSSRSRLETTAFDPEELDLPMANVKDFLRPETCKFYNECGIPLRRGYSFYGPPGTGKTSLVTVVATEFELPIYLIDLAEPGMTNQTLSLLLKSIPNRCLLVFEDMDTTGLPRNAKAGEPTVTLDGLFNALDGLSAAHGRMLFITTNNPDSLEEALTRPGRIDYRLSCPNASPIQATIHFKIMCQGHDDVKRMAAEFGRMVPDGIFSAAEIMLFLLDRREEPQRALIDANSWIKERTVHISSDHTPS
ncbi:hypothetical protein AK830_g179 [Neonectria ditissima]|uniref:AAA+ ATPase domain-containing protein n=1 Tax=Neonectria ditissima TaxID=78410 RepID=A0A0P7BHM7_9HYPO|nr:hypothetical protein AK830_g179 [Neonectria ditissima]